MTAQPPHEPAEEHEYDFHVVLLATVSVRSTSPTEALATLRDALDANTDTVEIAAYETGDPIKAFVSLAPGHAAELHMIDGEDHDEMVEIPEE